MKRGKLGLWVDFSLCLTNGSRTGTWLKFNATLTPVLDVQSQQVVNEERKKPNYNDDERLSFG